MDDDVGDEDDGNNDNDNDDDDVVYLTSTALSMTATLAAAATATATARNDIQSVASEMGEMIVIAARRLSHRFISGRFDSCAATKRIMLN